MNKPSIEFEPFRKIPRLQRDITVTEKLDGTSGTIYVDGTGEVYAASRNRWLTLDDDNFGFAAWVEARREQLMQLGVGWHRGEFYGRGIQRGYGLDHKRFALFNTARFCLHGDTPIVTPSIHPQAKPFTQIILPECVGLVPVLYSGPFDPVQINHSLLNLALDGSRAAPGFEKPEGIVVYHTAANVYFKQTIEHDNQAKSQNT